MVARSTLSRLFARRDALATELAAVDRAIDAGVREYSDAAGYRVTLRREAVRREIAA